MQVLFCTDGSKTSYNAILNFSHWFKSFSVNILSVSDMTYLPDSVLFNANKYVTECKNSTNSVIEYTQDLLYQKNINVSGILKLCGSAVDSILEIDKSNNYKYIIMGSNGKRGLQKWLGSVSQEVASESKSNVYISKANFDKKKNILFPVIRTTLSEEVIKTSVKDIDFTNSKVHLLTIYEMPEFLFLEGNIDSKWINDVDSQQQKESLKHLMDVEKIFIENGIKVENKVVLSGNPSEKILEYISLNDISLTVTGMRKRKGLSSLTISSVSRRVLENAGCDVLIYKEL